jgi:hypothetical protein
MQRFQLAWTIIIVFVAIMGTSLLSMKTAGRYDRIEDLKSQIKSDKEAIVLLGNELTVLASPERLKRLVDEHAMQLQAPEAEQILVAANDLSPTAGAPLPQLAQAVPQPQMPRNNNVPYVISWQKPAASPLPQQFADRAPKVLLASAATKVRSPLVSFAEPVLLAPVPVFDVPRDDVMTVAYASSNSSPPRVTKVAETSGIKTKITPEASVTSKAVLPETKKSVAPKTKQPRIEIVRLDVEPKLAAPKPSTRKSEIIKPDAKKAEMKVLVSDQKPVGLSSDLIDQIKFEAAREQRQ